MLLAFSCLAKCRLLVKQEIVNSGQVVTYRMMEPYKFMFSYFNRVNC